METHCLAQPFSCLGYEKAGEPSATPPPSRAPSSFLPLFHPLCIAVGHPRTNITLHQLGYFHFAHSAILLAQLGSIGRAQSIFFISVYVFDSNIFIREFQKEKFRFTTTEFVYSIIKFCSEYIFHYLTLILQNIPTKHHRSESKVAFYVHF